MELENYQIPQSYRSYVETFETDPEAAILRLKNRVEKRNAGAVGYFFLAWMYIKKKERENALEAAIQAKVRAPGSQLMNQMNYFISHPQTFKAWKPQKVHKTFRQEQRSYNRPHPIQNLDSLISKLSSVESRRIQLSEADDEQPDLSQESSNVDDIVTETLAVIHEKQKNYPAAIFTYQKLKNINSSKIDHYEKQIDRLQKKMQEKDSSEE